jgi:hypothetical protein
MKSGVRFDLHEVGLTVASHCTLRVAQLPVHITSTKEGLTAFMALFGEVTFLGLAYERHFTTKTLSEEARQRVEEQLPVSAMVRFSSPRLALSAKHCLDQLRIGRDKALDCGWIPDEQADFMLDHQPAWWYARERQANEERRRKVLRSEAKPTILTTAAAAAEAAAKASKAKAVELDEETTFTCTLLSNLFSPAEERAELGAEWVASIRDDVAGQVEDLKPEAVVVDDWTDKGRVLIRFSSEASARRCVDMLNGRAFGGRIVEAHVLSLAQAALVLQGRH